MSETDMNVDPQQFAVLIDRVNNLLTDSKEMRGQLGSIQLSLARIEQLPAEIAALRIQVESQAKTIANHALVIKICGTVLALCVGLIGWGWTEAKGFYARDQSADRRLYLIEFKLGLPAPPVEGSDK